MRFGVWATNVASRGALHWIVVLVWMAILAAAFFPGLMSADTLDMIRVGSDGSYTTEHSPLLCFIIARVVSGVMRRTRLPRASP